MIDKLISEHLTKLEKTGAQNVSYYAEKLEKNKHSEVIEDLLFEGRAALMFLRYGFSVTMRESPDLNIVLKNYQFYAEVKHFRLKDQDLIDKQNMAAYKMRLVSIGNTKPTETNNAWDQVVDVAIAKAKILVENVPNILVIGSSSPNCVDDSIVPTAINIISEKIRNSDCPNLDRLNGILLVSPEYNLTQKRNVYFFQAQNPRVSLSKPILESLYACTIA